MHVYYGGHISGVFFFFFKIGDLNGPFGLLMVIMQFLRQKLKVLDALHGTGTGKLVLYALLLECKDILGLYTQFFECSNHCSKTLVYVLFCLDIINFNVEWTLLSWVLEYV